MFDPSSLEHWTRGLIAAIISGGSQAGLTIIGVGGLQSMGVNIPTFTPKQLLLQCGVGGLIAAFTYLKQSPLPELVEKTTTTRTISEVVEKVVDKTSEKENE